MVRWSKEYSELASEKFTVIREPAGALRKSVQSELARYSPSRVVVKLAPLGGTGYGLPWEERWAEVVPLHIGKG